MRAAEMLSFGSTLAVLLGPDFLAAASERLLQQAPPLLRCHLLLPCPHTQGNAAFSAGKLDEAVKLFSRCIELDGSNHIYYSNRAAAHTSLKDYKAAVRDARCALAGALARRCHSCPAMCAAGCAG